MVTLACLAAAGLILGMFFNVYALAASCVAVVLIDFALAFDVEIDQLCCLSPLLLLFYKLGISPAS